MLCFTQLRVKPNMKLTGLLFTLTVTLVYSWNDGVIKFGVEDIDNPSVENMLRDILLHKSRHSQHQKLTLTSWSYNNCGNATTDLGILHSLTLGPDPLSFPGPLDVSFNATIKTTIDAPLAADVAIFRKVGSTYLKIPCILSIGSCHYDDLCDLLKGATCPKPFVDHNIPCKCPFQAGNYVLPKEEFDVLAAVFPPGDYKVNADLSFNQKQVACVNLTATITD